MKELVPAPSFFGISMVRTMEFAVTGNCNLRCLHCYQGADKGLNQEVAFSDVLAVIDDVKVLGFEQIVFTGGEFFYHSDWKKILLGSSLPFRIVSNGTLMDNGKVEFLKGSNILGITFSIDGLKDDHDFRRGKGNFEKTISATRELIKEGIDITANVTIDNRNSRYLDELHSFLVGAGFSKVIYLSLGRTGFFLDNESYLNYDDFTKKLVLELYKQLSAKAKSVKEKCDIFHSILSVDYFGDVYPCSFARDIKVFKLGNIYQNSLREIYYFVKNNPERFPFVSFDSSQLGSCKKCASFGVCKGKCRIRAYKSEKNFFDPDPFACAVYGTGSDENINALMWGDSN